MTLPKLPDLGKLLPDLSWLSSPFHPDNLVKPTKRKGLLESYLGKSYMEKIKARLRMDPKSLPDELRLKLMRGKPLNEIEQHTVVEKLSTW